MSPEQGNLSLHTNAPSAAQAVLRASEYPPWTSSGACGTGKDSAMKATIYAAVFGLALMFASAGQAGHMM